MKNKKEKVEASYWKILGSLLLLSCFLDSCQTQKIFTPALYHSDVSYLPKPSSGDSFHHQTYLSGGWGSASGLYNKDQINLYPLDASHARILKLSYF